MFITPCAFSTNGDNLKSVSGPFPEPWAAWGLHLHPPGPHLAFLNHNFY